MSAVAKTAEAQERAALDVVRAIAGLDPAESGAHLLGRTVRKTGKPGPELLDPDPGALVAWAEKQASKANVFVGGAPRYEANGKLGGTKAFCRWGWVLWADCDSPASVAALRSCPVEPTFVIETGSVTDGVAHLQGIWVLDREEPLDKDEIERLVAALAAHLGSDNVKDVSRVLRLPGTLNHKHDPPRPVVCVEANGLVSLGGLRGMLATANADTTAGVTPADSNGRPVGDWEPLDVGAVFDGIPKGQRDPVAYSYAGSLRSRDLKLPEALALMEVAWQRMEQPPGDPYPLEAALEKVERVYREKPAGRSAEFGGEPTTRANPTTWAPRTLGEALTEEPDGGPPDVLLDESGRGLLYRGKLHLVSGKPEALKSWLGAVAAVQVLAEGRPVVVIDADQAGAHDFHSRMLALGVEEEVAAGVHFPDFAAGREALDMVLWTAWMERQAEPGLFVCDSQNPTLAALGLRLNDDDAISNFQRLYLRPWTACGWCVLTPDHLPKDREADPDFAINSQRKLAGSDVHLRLTLDGPRLQRNGEPTRTHILCPKDKPAHHRRGTGEPALGYLHFEPRPDGSVQWRLQLDADARGPDAKGPVKRPTTLMERASEFVLMAGPSSQRKIEAGVTGKARALRRGLEVLVEEGYLKREHQGQAHIYSVVTPYREADDPQSDNYEGDADEG